MKQLTTFALLALILLSGCTKKEALPTNSNWNANTENASRFHGELFRIFTNNQNTGYDLTLIDSNSWEGYVILNDSNYYSPSITFEPDLTRTVSYSELDLNGAILASFKNTNDDSVSFVFSNFQKTSDSTYSFDVSDLSGNLERTFIITTTLYGDINAFILSFGQTGGKSIESIANRNRDSILVSLLFPATPGGCVGAAAGATVGCPCGFTIGAECKITCKSCPQSF